MIKIDEVTHWLILSGNIGHILCGSKSHWRHTTACGTWTPNGEIVSDRPKRKCKKCIEMLPKLRKVEKATP